MKKLIYILIPACLFIACNDGDNNAATQDPAEVHPPSEALPDTMKLVNDSAVVPDPTADTGVQAKVEGADSAQKNK